MKISIVLLVIALTLAGCVHSGVSKVETHAGLEQHLADLDGKFVSANDYERALPVINSGNVDLRQFPLSDSVALCQLSANRKVSIEYKTDELDSRNGESWPWYRIIVWNGPRKNHGGWVYGKYLTFQNGYSESFWNLRSTSRYGFVRQTFAEKFLEEHFGNYANKNGYDTTVLNQYRLISSEQIAEGFFAENGYRKNEYQTEWGVVSAFVSAQHNIWCFDGAVINSNNAGGVSLIGKSVSTLEEMFGKDHSLIDGYLAYNCDPFINQTYILLVKMVNNVVVSIRIVPFRP